MQSLNNLINPGLISKANKLGKLTKILRASLPTACQQHVAVAGIRDQQLILLADSPVWASRLRLYTQNMLEMLANHAEFKISSIQIKSSANSKIDKKEDVKQKRHLNQSTAELINQTAQSIADPELQSALFKLAKNKIS